MVQPIVSNPPFDSRISSLVGLKSSNRQDKPHLQRGYIIQEPGLGPIRYSVKFLYNPSVVQVSHQTDASKAVVTPQNYRNPLDKGAWNIPLNASASFNLLFDRTYELWSETGTGRVNDLTTGPEDAGVRTDVEALYRVVGILQPITREAGYSQAHSPYIYKNGDPGPMPLTPVQVYFGGANSLSYRGYISSIDVQWTHFSQLMVPMRCTVGVSMNLMVPNSSSWENKN
jgi:hypothetical protein